MMSTYETFSCIHDKDWVKKGLEDLTKNVQLSKPDHFVKFLKNLGYKMLE